MININTMELPITPREACSYVQFQTDNFGIFFDMDRCLELTAILQLEMTSILKEMRRLSNSPNLFVEKDYVIDALVKMGVAKGAFVGANGKTSLTAATCKLIADDPKAVPEARRMAEIYATYTSNKRNKGNIENYATQLPMSVALSKKGHRMTIGNPTWKLLNTSRIAASDPGIQGIPRSMGDIVCEPKGYTLVRCDSGQIEPRINASAYLKDKLLMALIGLYNDAYFGTLHYCLLTDEEFYRLSQNVPDDLKPMNLTDDIKDQRQNIKRLTNAGAYGSTNLGDINPRLADVYNKRIVNHPSRKALELNVRDSVHRGIETFYGYFGTPVTPDSTEKYQKGGSGWNEHVIRCGINNPIQTTASELMMFSINEARKIISEAKDTHICFYKHDEACFYVSDEDMANGIGDKLSDVTAYQVEGWLPIYADALIGVKKGDYPSYII